MKQVKIFKPLIDVTQPRLEPDGPLSALYLIGSYADLSCSPDSDLDLLVVLSDNADGPSLVNLGVSLRKGLATSFPDQKLFFFDAPSLDTPDIVPSNPMRVHMLVHRKDWVIKSIEKRNFVFMSWCQRHKLLAGQDLLSHRYRPELNDSLIDEFDGLPSVVSRIDYSILSLDSETHEKTLLKLADYAKARISEILEFFPQLRSCTETEDSMPESPVEGLLYLRQTLQFLTVEIRRTLNSHIKTANNQVGIEGDKGHP